MRPPLPVTLKPVRPVFPGAAVRDRALLLWLGFLPTVELSISGISLPFRVRISVQLLQVPFRGVRVISHVFQIVAQGSPSSPRPLFVSFTKPTLITLTACEASWETWEYDMENKFVQL